MPLLAGRPPSRLGLAFLKVLSRTLPVGSGGYFSVFRIYCLRFLASLRLCHTLSGLKVTAGTSCSDNEIVKRLVTVPADLPPQLPMTCSLAQHCVVVERKTSGFYQN